MHTPTFFGDQPNLLPVMFSPEHTVEAAVNILNAAVYDQTAVQCFATVSAPLG